jgi:hypothetical protein
MTSTPTRPAAPERTTSPRRTVAVNLVVNVAAPIAIFYGARAVGVNQWWALMLSALPPAVHGVQTIVARRRIDALGVFTLSILGLSLLASFLTGSPRLLLARDGWLTATGGLWMLATLARTPFYYQIVRVVLSGAMRERAEAAWRDSPRFRHSMRVATAIWGTGLVLDAGVRVALAYSLPIDQVPLVNGLQYVVVFLILEVSSRVYVRRAAGRDLRGPQAAR